MTANAAILVGPSEGWAKPLLNSLSPGAHVFVVTNELAGIEARVAGFEVRDTVLILSQGPRSRYALLRKPPTHSTVLSQIVETATGALNITACRIGWGSEAPSQDEWNAKGSTGSGSPNIGQNTEGMREAYANGNVPVPAGRWPPNILLVHGDTCVRKGTVRVASSQPRTRTKAAGFHPDNKVFGTGKGEFFSIGYGDEDGLETISFWECDPKCSVRALDEQSGQRPSTLTGRADPRAIHVNPGDNNGKSLFGGGNSNVYADHGGASRYYPQFANDDEMVKWMKNLIEIPEA
jgi:hypothetical protein